MATSVDRALQSHPEQPACAGRKRLTWEKMGRSEPAPSPTVFAALIRSHMAPGWSWTCPRVLS